MTHELLTPSEMSAADRLAISSGIDGSSLMERAGWAVASEVLRHYPTVTGIDVLCGPGNNGGDGYVAARLLASYGCDVAVYAHSTPKARTDAAHARDMCSLPIGSLADFSPLAGRLVIDALFGAGLARSLEGAAAIAAIACAKADVPVVSVDLPSGISGLSGMALGAAFRADLTVTFFRRKPGHLLEPGRSACGALVLADIGIPDRVLNEIRPLMAVNEPTLWLDAFPRLQPGTHKYSRGHVAVLSGPSGSTGAARLAVSAAQRAGAGAVTLLSPSDALPENAIHLTSAMLRPAGDAASLAAFIEARKVRAIVIGPGAGIGAFTRSQTLAALGSKALQIAVLDADALTIFSTEPQTLFDGISASRSSAVLTPHTGEFVRLFPDLASDDSISKLQRARAAAQRSNSIVLLKGSDTVIAAPDGRAAINCNGSPLLATAGSGDVLAGLVAGLAGQGVPAYEAACAAAWIHAEAGERASCGLIAEDLPTEAAKVISQLMCLTS